MQSNKRPYRCVGSHRQINVWLGNKRVGKSLYRSNSLAPLHIHPFFLCSNLSCILWHLVWLHEELSVVTNSISVFFLSASVLRLDSALFHLLMNSGTSAYLGLCFPWMFVSLILSVGRRASTNAADTDSTPDRPQSAVLALCHFVKVTSSHRSPPEKQAF